MNSTNKPLTERKKKSNCDTGKANGRANSLLWKSVEIDQHIIKNLQLKIGNWYIGIADVAFFLRKRKKEKRVAWKALTCLKFITSFMIFLRMPNAMRNLCVSEFKCSLSLNHCEPHLLYQLMIHHETYPVRLLVSRFLDI